MKIKQDFVTNSSSTSFIFIFKGDKIDLYRALINHSDLFQITESIYDYDEIGSINVWDVIRSIDGVILSNNNDLWIKPPLYNIEKYISGVQEYFDTLKSRDEDEWIIKFKNTLKDKIKLLEEYNKTKFNKVFEIEFGDNDGHIQGVVGTILDYNHKDVKIESNDLVIITESKH